MARSKGGDSSDGEGSSTGARILTRALDDGGFSPPTPKTRERGADNGSRDDQSGATDDPVRRYTDNSDELNRYLRTTDKSSYSPEDRARLDKQADEISEALKKRPVPDERITWRGLPGGEWLDKYKKGGLYSDPAFMSTSTSEAVANRFKTIATGGFSGDQRPGAIFKVDGITGRDVGRDSSFTHQKEVLFDRGALFKITDKRQDGDTTYIDMTQLG
ncbi:ADP-ribosyltransferase [Glycomyces sp. YM15]|uniref:ADP-ribosyltransferase n=1 Tax=Glycomyces sp. YM15 TaxID=2800446 RepID=UPI0019644E03|nr:ADP-ribosyltransferase [Glycomyces sp. YM15]